MSDLICEEIARRAGFQVSVGNWIAPNGGLILGTDYHSHHWDTLLRYWGDSVNQKMCIECENHLQCMNTAVDNGYIRLVFRADVLFQVGAERIDDLWSDQSNYVRMLDLLKSLTDVDIHIFSKRFYIIGEAQYLVSQEINRLQMKVT